MSEEDIIENDYQKRLSKTSHSHSNRTHDYYRYFTNISDDNINAISGAIAGVTAGVVVCPLDVAKTRLQAQGGLLVKRDGWKYSGIIGTVSTIFKDEGIRGLYRGIVPIVIGYIPTWTIYFFLYEKSKALLSKKYRITSDELATPSDSLETHPRQSTMSTTLNPFIIHIFSALCAGSASTIITNPIWVVKTRLMSQGTHTFWNYKGTFDAIKQMYTQEGIGVFYQGLGPALLGLSHVAVQFPLYEQFKLIFTNPNSSDLSNNLGIMLSSGLSKLAASSITYPHEVIRTRNQIQFNNHNNKNPTHIIKYRGIWKTAKTIYIDEGWRAFYAGLGTNMFRAVPSSAVTLLTYEMVSRHFRHCRNEGIKLSS